MILESLFGGSANHLEPSTAVTTVGPSFQSTAFSLLGDAGQASLLLVASLS